MVTLFLLEEINIKRNTETLIKMKSAKSPVKCNFFSRDFTMEDILNNSNLPTLILHARSIEKCVSLEISDVSVSVQPVFK